MRNKKGRFTNIQVEAKRLFYVRFRLSRFCYLLKVGFTVAVLLIVPSMAWLSHIDKGTWRFDGAVIEFPAIETAQAVEAEPVNVERLLRAVCIVESNCTADRVGDAGRSFGAFQINRDAHPDVTIEKAFDFEFSKAWTLNHCKRYTNDVRMFAKCHNGIGKTTNGWYMDRVERAYLGSI